jgi:recombination protein RecR
VREVIIALDSTLEGDAKSLYLKKHLDAKGVPTTRLAFGLPMGSSLDFVDYGTLEKAFNGRQKF